jgi:hypothetical protein
MSLFDDEPTDDRADATGDGAHRGEAVIVYTDGACSGNPGPGGWAWAVAPDGHPRGCGAESHTTNQRMEVLATLRAVGLGPRVVDTPTDEGRGAVVLAVRGEPATGRGRAGYAMATRRRIAQVVAEARTARRSVVAVLFGPPSLAEEVPEAPNVICAWSGDRAMQEAAARRMA